MSENVSELMETLHSGNATLPKMELVQLHYSNLASAVRFDPRTTSSAAWAGTAQTLKKGLVVRQAHIRPKPVRRLKARAAPTSGQTAENIKVSLQIDGRLINYCMLLRTVACT
eukprot:TRINITY_DN43933_c0_g1_i1.p1 TRINITY_DN43933_c0_g1~~TRINITY_DN43933_c0_g1_i1.p1  ORF type:complete len:113 (+),score=8.51 TRINITY_DN43933_c0_g1_i1:128-466(+)